jgi:Mce-associated membrane protein
MSKEASVAEITKADDNMGDKDPTEKTAAAEPVVGQQVSTAKFADRSIRLRTILSILLAAALVGLSAFLAWQLQSTSSDLDSIKQSSTTRRAPRR